MQSDKQQRDMLRDLHAVDWDFPHRIPGASSSLHWYPATFHASLPATLIEALSSPGDLIFDPYAGTGATGIEAVRLFRRAWLVDANPVAVLASYTGVGLALLERGKRGRGEGALGALYDAVAPLRGPQRSLFGGEPREERFESELAHLLSPLPGPFIETILGGAPQWGELAPWFHPSTLRQIRAMRALVDRLSDGWLRSLGLSMMSAVLRNTSSQNKSWGHVADRVLPEETIEKDVISAATRWLATTRATLRGLTFAGQIRSAEPAAYVSRFDWLEGPSGPRNRPRKGVPLMLTSPPYADAIDYFRAQRLSLLFLGYSEADIDQIAATEIGSRRKRFRGDSQKTWETEVVAALARQVCFVRGDQPHIAIVLPHRDPIRDDYCARVRGHLESMGWCTVFETTRSIRGKKARQSWTSISQECVIVFSPKE